MASKDVTQIKVNKRSVGIIGLNGVLEEMAAEYSQRPDEEVQKELEEHNIFVKAASWKGISEEAPQVYKDIDEVIKVSDKSGIAKTVARVRPIGVIKG